jgi:hypothetical protein
MFWTGILSSFVLHVPRIFPCIRIYCEGKIVSALKHRAMKRCRGVEVKLPSLFAKTLEGGECSVSFSPRDTVNKKLHGTQSRSEYGGGHVGIRTPAL